METVNSVEYNDLIDPHFESDYKKIKEITDKLEIGFSISFDCVSFKEEKIGKEWMVTIESPFSDEGAFSRGNQLSTAMRSMVDHLEYIVQNNTPINGDKFANTQRGYFYAQRYLLEKGLTDKIEHEQSTDGYTLTALANQIYSKENKS